jgi:transitional endoplasmic reticulum ATPase
MSEPATSTPPAIMLHVAEARVEDIAHGVARLSPADLERIGARIGQIVKLTGRTTAVARAEVSDPQHDGVVQIDGTIRSNCGASLDEQVTVAPVESAQAVAVRLTPLLSGGAAPIIAPERMLEDLVGVPVVAGGALRIPTFAKAINFQVVRTIPSGPVVIGPRTDIRVVEGEQAAVSAPAVSYEDIGGLEREVARVRELVELPLKHARLFERLGILAPKGVLLYGPPGTGKTLLARAVAAESRVHFIHLNGPEIMRKFYGESEARLRELFEEAARRAPAILFIDEIDAVAPKRADVAGEVEKRVVAQLLSLMDGFVSRGQVIVMGATNLPEVLDPALRRPGRFDREIEIGVPNTQARLQILRIHTRAMPLAPDVNLAEIAEHSHGFVGADLEALCQEVGMIALRRFLATVRLTASAEATAVKKPDTTADTVRLKADTTGTTARLKPDTGTTVRLKADTTDDASGPSVVSGFSRTVIEDDVAALEVTRDDFLAGLSEVEPSATREFYIEKSTTTFASIGGHDELKRLLDAIVERSHRADDLYEQMGLEPPRGILFVGPSGTGKTAMARALSGEKQIPLIAVDGPQLYSKWFGESEKALRDVFKKARRAAPCLLFFDNVDALAPRNAADPSGAGVHQRLLSQLLREIDNLRDVSGVTLLAATDRPDRVEPALLRSGRFDYVLAFAKPDANARAAILRVCCRQIPLAPDVDLDELGRSTSDLTGADLEAVCKKAALAAISHFQRGERGGALVVRRSDFESVLAHNGPAKAGHYRNGEPV